MNVSENSIFLTLTLNSVTDGFKITFSEKVHFQASTYFGQMTFAQGLFEGQFLCKFLAIVA